MNTLQLIKARTSRTRAMQRARLQMAKAFGSADHTDATHTLWALSTSHSCATAALLTTLFDRSRKPPVDATFDTAA